MKVKYLLGLLLPLLITSCGEKSVVKYKTHKITESNTVLDCKGKKFKKGNPTEIRIESTDNKQITNVTIKNCKITGSIRTIGLGRNGESEAVKESSHTLGHTKRAQDIAPKYVRIENVEITGVGKIPLYIGPGTTNMTVIDSIFTGESNSVALYMDAESGYNMIHNNTFSVEGNWTPRQFRVREVIAVDGSAHNTISENIFEKTPGGGIYLYRNCGEGGTVRHQKPQHNYIVDNAFDLKELSWGNYGIFLGAREGKRTYCDADKGYPFGSSVSDLDHANNNILNRNKFIGSDRDVKDRGKNNIIN
ncbi:MAG: right-handed parallel beta-helix repeat-containing protein [Candidatus Lokiarchaeota archaeon]|nr:right-handed parallel beta-helix repeat-containing protein [Candidatus Lokiarchaeota archaeon]